MSGIGDRTGWKLLWADEFDGPEGTPPDPGRWALRDHPFYLLLNLAVGGHFGGPPAADLALPQTYLVDYVRVYERA
jgi:beta-glucanase (GH16 family)